MTGIDDTAIAGAPRWIEFQTRGSGPSGVAPLASPAAEWVRARFKRRGDAGDV